MTPHELFRPAAAPKTAQLTAVLRRLVELWWFGVRTHVAAMHGLPRPAEPPRPDQIWPFGHM